jgi:IPT/TIG domain
MSASWLQTLRNWFRRAGQTKRTRIRKPRHNCLPRIEPLEERLTPAPTVTSVSPPTGLVGGGATINIAGTGFSGATHVNFGGSNAVTFTVVSSTQISAVDPTGSGTVDVTVSTAQGTSATGPQDQFTYAAVSSVYLNGDYAPIVAISDNGGTIMATTDGSDNGFTAGTNNLVIGGFTGALASYNGTWSISSTPASNQFTFTGPSGLSSSTGNTLGYAISQTNAPTITGTGLMNRQRSMADSVAYSFTAPVSLTAAQFTLSTVPPTTNGFGPTPATATPGMNLTSLSGGAIWVVTWVSGGGAGASVTGRSIANGVYDITLANSGRATDTFYRLYGDIQGGGVAKVNNADNSQFALGAYLQTNGSDSYQAGFDYFGTGSVNNPDVGQFGADYLATWSGFSPTI